MNITGVNNEVDVSLFSEDALPRVLGTVCRGIHANISRTIRFKAPSSGHMTKRLLLAGYSYGLVTNLIQDAEPKGAADTVITVTKSSNDITYTYTGTGTNPLIGTGNTVIGSEVQIKDTGLDSDNEGLFTVTAIGTNSFTVVNSAGIAEATKTIGATGLLAVFGLIPAEMINVTF